MNTEEQVLFEDQGIKVTNLRAIIQSKTYAMSNITSVEMAEKPASGCGPAIFIIGGLLVAVAYLSQTISNFNIGNVVGILIGVALAASGFYFQKMAKSTFTIKIGSASGESNIMESGNKDMITRIVAAMNDAIVRRG